MTKDEPDGGCYCGAVWQRYKQLQEELDDFIPEGRASSMVTNVKPRMIAKAKIIKNFADNLLTACIAESK